MQLIEVIFVELANREGAAGAAMKEP